LRRLPNSQWVWALLDVSPFTSVFGLGLSLLARNSKRESQTDRISGFRAFRSDLPRTIDLAEMHINLGFGREIGSVRIDETLPAPNRSSVATEQRPAHAQPSLDEASTLSTFSMGRKSDIALNRFTVRTKPSRQSKFRILVPAASAGAYPISGPD